MSDSLATDISKLLFEREPGLLICDDEASARAAVAVSHVMGCVLATVLAKYGQKEFESALTAVQHETRIFARKVAAKAAQMPAESEH